MEEKTVHGGEGPIVAGLRFGQPGYRSTAALTVCWEKLTRGGVPNRGGFQIFSGKVQIVSRTLSGLFLVGAVNRPRKRKGQIGKIPEESPDKSGKSRKKIGKVPKRTKKDDKRKDKSRSGNPPV